MTPVIVLTDGYLANGSEPWQVPELDDLIPFDVKFADKSDLLDGQFMAYLRDKDTLARPWAIPGTEALEHRIGGLEKEDVTGNVSYDPENHHYMVETRAKKVESITQEFDPTEIYGDKSGDVLILSWGGIMGSCRAAAESLQKDRQKVSHVHLRWVNPLPKDLGEILMGFKHVLIPEINFGQLIQIIRAEYLVDAKGLNQVRGKPISSSDIEKTVKELIG
jgi:2-oxoglutarate ferredoxin oxidoreductase subunit alpha